LKRWESSGELTNWQRGRVFSYQRYVAELAGESGVAGMSQFAFLQRESTPAVGHIKASQA
jgi:hypothetical protein